MCCSGVATKAQSITVNTTDYKQTIDMVGGDMERSSKVVQFTVQNKQDVIDWGFKDIHFNYCRVQFDKTQELEEGTKNWASYERQVATMKDVKAVNPNIKFYATMRSDYDGYGNENNMPDWIVNYNTKAVNTDKYAIFLADYLEFMHNEGVTIHTLATAKEWGAFVTATVSRDIILKLQQECQTRNIPMPLINDPGSWSMAAGLSFMNSVDNLGTKDLYTAFSSHEYASNDIPEQEWPTLVAKAQSLGKKLYQDETITGVSNTGEVPVFRYAQRAVLYQSGLSGEIFFEIWSRGVNSEIRPIYWKWGGTASRLNGYYLIKHFANNVLDSQYITSTAQNVIGGAVSATQYGGITTMAFRKGNKVMLWVMNFTSPSLSTVDYPSMTFTIENSTIVGDVENVYWNTGSAIEGTAASITPASSTSFQTEIKENSINVFTFTVNDNPLSTNNAGTIDTDFRVITDSLHHELVFNKPLQSFKIVNISGAIIQTGKDEISKLNISAFSEGVYVLQGVTSENKQVTYKFVKR
ncbi:hypothetical protein FUMI01_24340 [Flavobacterium sp. UMI-01]|nr:hypothetical protein FUMI01_24340 [Flavobacterium sp. UMI-01]